jgi:hypothetical protein
MPVVLLVQGGAPSCPSVAQRQEWSDFLCAPSLSILMSADPSGQEIVYGGSHALRRLPGGPHRPYGRNTFCGAVPLAAPEIVIPTG